MSCCDCGVFNPAARGGGGGGSNPASLVQSDSDSVDTDIATASAVFTTIAAVSLTGQGALLVRATGSLVGTTATNIAGIRILVDGTPVEFRSVFAPNNEQVIFAINYRAIVPNALHVIELQWAANIGALSAPIASDPANFGIRLVAELVTPSVAGAGGALPAPGPAGSVLVSDGSQWVSSTVVDRTFQVFGALAIVNGTSYLYPGGDYSANSTGVSPFAFAAPFDGRALRMRILHNALTGATDIPYTLQVNEVDTALTVTLNSGVQAGTNLANIINYNAGDRIRVKAVNGSGATLTVRPVVVIEFWTP